jgi:hypothetical protein
MSPAWETIEIAKLLPISNVALDENLSIFGIGTGTTCPFVYHDSLGIVDNLKPFLTYAGTPVQIFCIQEIGFV